jgi:methylmalonyl-CoA/ethylmalonyl-CoA epimerase
MKVNRVDHVGIAVTNLDEAIKFYEALGLKCTNIETIDEQKVKVAFFPCGDADLELLESTTPDGPVAKYIEKNGGKGGIQHMALNVTDVKEAIADMKALGMRMIDEEPRYGAGNSSIAFVHPKCTGGVLIELAQRL